jgi:hypothetical protein
MPLGLGVFFSCLLLLYQDILLLLCFFLFYDRYNTPQRDSLFLWFPSYLGESEMPTQVDVLPKSLYVMLRLDCAGVLMS